MENTIRVLGFKTTYHRRPDVTDVIERDWVKFAPIHDIKTVNEEMVHILKPKKIEEWEDDGDKSLKVAAMEYLWKQIEPHYKAYKEGTEVPLHGIPLAAWAGLSTEQANVLKKEGIRTVEEIASMTESQLNKLMLPNPRSIKTMAISYLESRKGTEIAGKVTVLEEEREALKEQLNEMARMIAEMREKKAEGVSFEGDDAVAAEKRGPGRPRKSKPEEAA